MNILNENCIDKEQKLEATQLIQILKILLHDININTQRDGNDFTTFDNRVAVCQMQDSGGTHHPEVYKNCLKEMKENTSQNELTQEQRSRFLPIFYVILGHAQHWHLRIHYKEQCYNIDSTTSFKSSLRNLWHWSSINSDYNHFTRNQSDEWSCGYHCLDMLMNFLKNEIEFAQSHTKKKIDSSEIDSSEIDISKAIDDCYTANHGSDQMSIIQRVLLKWASIVTDDTNVRDTLGDVSDEEYELLKPPTPQISESLKTIYSFMKSSTNKKRWNEYCITRFSEKMYVRLADIKMTNDELSDWEKTQQQFYDGILTFDEVDNDEIKKKKINSAIKIQRLSRRRSTRKSHKNSDAKKKNSAINKIQRLSRRRSTWKSSHKKPDIQGKKNDGSNR